MAFKRYADAQWNGDLQSGKGGISTPQSGLFDAQNFSFKTRFGDEKGTNPEELLGATERLLDRERVDERELKRLSKDLRDLRGTSVWPVLVEMMERDTEKHQGILRFVKQQLDDQMKRMRKN